MKKYFLLVVCLLLNKLAKAQEPPPPPPDACPPSGYVLSSFCSSACVLCDGLDGFTNNNEATDLGEAPPGFCAPGLHNTQWVGFVAGSTNLTLDIFVYNCIDVNGDPGNGGLQIGIYNTVNCDNYQLVSNCEVQVPPNTTTTFNANNLTPGGIYFLVIDGYDGDICDFDVTVVAGSTDPPDVSGPAQPQGPIQICTGGTASYFADVFGAGVYEWTLDGNVISYDQFTDITFTEDGTYEVCVTGSNPCSAGEQSCITVDVGPLPLEDLGDVTLCFGEIFEYQGYVFSETGTYDFEYTSAEECIQPVTVDITVLDVLEETVGPFELCQNDPPLIINNQPYSPFDEGLQSQLLTSVDGCDSTIYFDIIVNPVTIEVDVRYVCEDDIPTGGIEVAGEFFDASDSGIPQQVIDVNEFGCDHIINFLLWVGQTPEPAVEFATICEGEFYELGFAFYDTPGTYSETLETAFGCDSMVQVVLDVYYDPLDTIYQELCYGESMLHGGTEISTTGTYSHTFQSADLACDSTVTIELTVLPENNTFLNEEICEGENFQVGTFTYEENGDYTHTFTDEYGCDSMVYLTLTVLPLEETILNETICAEANFTVGNNTYNDTGTYSNTFTGTDGCDSIVILNLTVNAAITTMLNESICEGDVFSIGTENFNSAGVHLVVLQAIDGCDSTITLNLELIETPITDLDIEICIDDTYTIGTTDYNQTGYYTETLAAASGCDSIVNLDLTVINITPTDLDITICTGQSYTVGTNTFTEAGYYSSTLAGYLGCDSTINLNLVIEDVIRDTLLLELCDGESYSVGSNTYLETGFYSDDFVTADGCDSTFYLDLIVHPILETYLIESICEGENFQIGSSIYDQPGNFMHTFNSAVTGCDSIVYLELIVLEVPATNLIESICEGESFQVGSSTYSSEGAYQDILTAANGCDSIVHLELTILDVPLTNLAESICDGETYQVGSSTYNTNGNFQDILIAANGCDSIVNLDLTILEVPSSNLQALICNGSSFEIGSSSYTTSGFFVDTLTAVNGCDSIVSLDLFVAPNPVTDIIQSICIGSEYVVGTETFTASGAYQVILPSQYNCDSTINLNLTVTDFYETNLNEEICEGESFQIGVIDYEESGNYSQTFTSSDNCDSIVNLNLIVHTIPVTNLDESICEGESFMIGTTSYNAPGSYQEILTAYTGCDSIVHLNLQVNEIFITDLTEFLCEGEEIVVGASTYTSSGTFSDVLTSSNGCDSIVNLSLSVFEIPVTDLVENVCYGDTYQVGDMLFSESGNFTEVLTANTGCDSIVHLQLTIDPLIETHLEEIICFDSSFPVGNSNYDQSGNYTDTLTAMNGCDSIVNLSLTVRAINETFLVEEICAGETYEVGASQYTTTGTYLEVLTSEETICDSFVHLALDVVPLEETYLTEAICDGEAFVVANSTYTVGGEYIDIVTASTGCDSTIYLDLTVFEIPITTLDETICEGEIYNIGNTAYTQTGNYTNTLQAYTSCDSIVYLNLFVIEQEETFLVEEICEGETFQVGNSSYSTSGEYMDVIISSVGCDSFVYLSLVVNDVYEVFLEELICNDEVYEVGTNSFNQTGAYTIPLQSITACDSIIQLNLTTHPCELAYASAEKPASCFGEADGSITFTMTEGVPPYTYSWEAINGGMNGVGELNANDQNESISGLTAGIYHIRVTDYYGVMIDFMMEVTQPEVIFAYTDLLTYDIYHTSCFGESDGVATALANGGTPPYSYLWNHGETSAIADGLTAGNYYVTITDQNGCVSVAEATLTAPMPLEGDFSTLDPFCYGDAEGIITIENPEGGVPPYVYSVDNLPFSNNNVFDNLNIGSHLIAIQDANGCMWEDEAMIQQPEELTVDLGEDILIALGDSLRLNALSSYPVDSFEWSFILNSTCMNCPNPALAPFSTSTYSVTVIDANGCTATDDIQIFVEKHREVYIPNVFSPNNDGQNDLFMIFAGNDVTKVNSFLVFNRWGETMFEVYNFQPNDPAYGWNGDHRSREMNTGVYVFLAEVEFIDGEVLIFKGDLTLVR